MWFQKTVIALIYIDSSLHSPDETQQCRNSHRLIDWLFSVTLGQPLQPEQI